ncbi:MAG: RimK family alpha-L-glutamate ligase [Deltaproteobacteria bacterium]|nr:RimK family alpha-L-glutamate ligase [Deltaproteobacteria bacterium]
MGRLRIGLLSRGSTSYSSKRLIEASRARGHSVEVLDTARFALIVDGGGGEVRYKGRALAPFDAIIPRIGTSMTLVGTAIVRHLEQRGVFVQNGSHAITVARDKLRALQVLARNGVPIPTTAFGKSGEDLGNVLDTLRGPSGTPVILKLLEGTQGVGVMLADTRNVAQAILETLESMKADVLLQRFVEESRGRDIRAFVVGGRVIGAMRRTARGEEFRSNVHRGASVESVRLDPTYEEVAKKAARVLGLSVAGVDMLEGKDGPLVMEVNASPGLEGIEAATGIDVAMAVVRNVEERLSEPTESLREVASLEKGHVVGELSLGPRNRLVGVTIAESKLDALDVRVLMVRRGSLAMPSPSASTRLFVGDTLVLFGKRESLDSLIARS